MSAVPSSLREGATVLRPKRDALISNQSAGWLVLGALLIMYPQFVPAFWTYQVGAQSLILGTIAMSLSLLAGQGGMVTLSQMTVAGISAYLVCIFGTTSVQQISLGWPWWLAISLALLIATMLAVAIGALSIRTEGIRTIMITLAIGVAFFYLAQQNYALFNGYQGFSGISAGVVAGVDLAAPVPFYYLCLAVAALLVWLLMSLARSTFGIGLQGVRDNPRRMASLGFSVVAHRLIAHAIAGLIASIGGVLFVFLNHQVSPGSVATPALINVLVIAVLGGMRRPLGAFLGAASFVLLQNFAIDLVSRERFNLVIGGVFLAVLLVSPDGVLGLITRLRSSLRPAPQQRI